MRSDLVSNTLSVLGGASLGAIAMYLLDPDQGQHRRGMIADSAGRVAAGTTSTVNSKVHDAVGSARDFAGSVGQYAHDLADRVSQQVHRGAEAASDEGHSAVDHVRSSVQSVVGAVKGYASHASDQAYATRDQLTDRAHSLYSQAKTSARRKAGFESSHPYATATGITAGTVGVLAIGAGLMYFLDPERGRGRRARVRDRALSATHKAGKSARRYGRHLGNRVQGYAHDAGSSLPQDWSDAVDRETLAVASMTDGHPLTEPS